MVWSGIFSMTCNFEKIVFDYWIFLWFFQSIKSISFKISANFSLSHIYNYLTNWSLGSIIVLEYDSPLHCLLKSLWHYRVTCWASFVFKLIYIYFKSIETGRSDLQHYQVKKIVRNHILIKIEEHHWELKITSPLSYEIQKSIQGKHFKCLLFFLNNLLHQKYFTRMNKIPKLIILSQLVMCLLPTVKCK